jgi:hypothetical protein
MTRSILEIAVIWCFAAFWTASMASAEIYRWVDEEGEMHLVSELADVPPEHREAAIANSKRGGGTVNIIEGLDDAPPPAKIAAPEPSETAETSTPEPGEPADRSDDVDVYGADPLARAMERERRRRVGAAEPEAGEGPGDETTTGPAEERAGEPPHTHQGPHE